MKRRGFSPSVRYNRVAREARVFLEEKGRFHWIGEAECSSDRSLCKGVKWSEAMKVSGCGEFGTDLIPDHVEISL